MLKFFHEPALDETYLSGEKVFDGVLLKVQKDTVKLPNGNTSTREYIHHAVI